MKVVFDIECFLKKNKDTLMCVDYLEKGFVCVLQKGDSKFEGKSKNSLEMAIENAVVDFNHNKPKSTGSLAALSYPMATLTFNGNGIQVPSAAPMAYGGNTYIHNSGAPLSKGNITIGGFPLTGSTSGTNPAGIAGSPLALNPAPIPPNVQISCGFCHNQIVKQGKIVSQICVNPHNHEWFFDCSNCSKAFTAFVTNGDTLLLDSNTINGKIEKFQYDFKAGNFIPVP